jgi:MYXO-CTERM domain-containing protein
MLSWSQHAAALKPSRHKKISVNSCLNAGLPSDFCARVGREAYNTDAHEWEHMPAHAQAEPGQSACDGAQHTVERMTALGDELLTALDELVVEADQEPAVRVATALGRALHTIQDNCAHSGMTNSQHAWHTLADFCDQSDDDPDKRPSARSCADRQTDAVMGTVAKLIERAGVANALAKYSCEPEWPSPRENEQDDPCTDVFLPAPWEACSFLGKADEWDGVDRRWNRDLIGRALLAAFTAALDATPPAAADVCNGDPTTIAATASRPPVDTGDGPDSCGLAHLLCLGKADSTESFFADDEALAPSPEPSAGCSVAQIDGSPSPARSPWPLLVGALLLLGALRRRVS